MPLPNFYLELTGFALCTKSQSELQAKDCRSSYCLTAWSWASHLILLIFQQSYLYNGDINSYVLLMIMINGLAWKQESSRKKKKQNKQKILAKVIITYQMFTICQALYNVLYCNIYPSSRNSKEINQEVVPLKI